MTKIESDILVGIQKAAFDKPGVVKGARALSHFGEHSLGWMGLGAAGAVVATVAKRDDKNLRNKWIRLGAAAFVAHAVSVVVKRIVRRKRPHDERIKVGVGTPSKLSFPSSHATSTSAALTALSQISGSRVPLIGIPVMMLSRMVLGVHYPTDVTVGALIGALTAKFIMKEK
ncbi:MAG: phosphatase PAP2 family protein [Corynebacterium sp.]|nr:phosphatase PAP2 family protein [Corynebacterium sp.]